MAQFKDSLNTKFDYNTVSLVISIDSSKLNLIMSIQPLPNMCGRYTIVARAEEIEKRFNIEVPEFYEPRYNAAPSQVLPVITNQSPEGLVIL